MNAGGVRMVEIMEVKHIPWGGEVGNVIVRSLDDLKKIADLNKKPLIFKKDKEYFLVVHPSVFRYKAQK